MPRDVLHFESFSRRELLRTAAGSAVGFLFVGRFGVWAKEEAPPALRDGKQLKVHSPEPLNAEADVARLVEAWVTPVEQFYVRSHGTTPIVDGKAFKLSIEGEVERPLELSLDELRKFPRESLHATLTCAGNRRSEFSAVKPVKGVQWGAGAIGNARWSGVRLSSLLNKAGVKEAARHVWFESLDAVKRPDGTAFAFGASVPIAKALEPMPDGPGVLLADTMNDKPLPIDHGFPLRGVVPGYIGARSVKWLTRIVVSDRPSPNPFVQDVYKVVETEDLSEAHAKTPIYEYPINAAIGRPTTGAKVEGPTIKVVGYALPNGAAGGGIDRVELSTDGGRSWQRAEFLNPAQPYCWRLWTAQVPVAAGATSISVRAIDSTGARQPESGEWNAKGYLYNGWHTISISRA